jgi:transketolase
VNHDELRRLSNEMRKRVLVMTNRAGSSHIGSNYSMVELLVVLYNGILRLDPARPEWAERDRFVLSKGHACAAFYAVLAERGFFPLDWLDTFYLNGSRLAGHATHTHIPGIEVSTGSLGHGFSLATGMALVAKRDDKKYRIFALLSDGECDEGSTWEAALFASHHGLDNLTVIVDYNKIQAMGPVREVLDLEPFAAKWHSFGWAVREIDGHDLEEVETSLSEVPYEPGCPSCVIAHTVKGKGVSFMEDDVLWHYRSPQGEEFEAALMELEASV